MHLPRYLLLIIFGALVVINGTLAWFVWQAYSPESTIFITPNQRSSKTVDELRLKASNPLNRDDYLSFLTSVSKVATTTNQVDVKGCTITPRVIRIKNNTSINFTNSGDSTVFLTLPVRKSVRIDEKTSLEFKVQYSQHMPVAFGIGCGGERVASGILYVTD